MRGAVGVNGCVERAPVIGTRLGDDLEVVFVLVGVGLQVRGVGVEHPALDETPIKRLLDDGVENVLRDGGVVEAAAAVLAQG